ncbi:hypothetical protein [Gemmatimonas aurantiaca]|uniref:hypothetical protein n=1 Tax=Gemmatimonas aurantiaca TaxID=173480 RepID=UPI0012EA1830|nr:hypothetical protein [Gemmatimonas aurantiaca]
MKGFNPLHPATYQITVAGAPLNSPDIKPYDVLAGLLGWSPLEEAKATSQVASALDQGGSQKPKPTGSETKGTQFFNNSICNEQVANQVSALDSELWSTLREVHDLAGRARVSLAALDIMRANAEALSSNILADENNLNASVFAMKITIDTLQILGAPSDRSFLTTVRQSLIEDQMQMNQLKSKAEQGNCIFAQSTLIASEKRISLMVRDMAMIDTAMSFAGRNLEILRKAVATWSHLVASPSAFVASATAGPYQTSTEVSISVKRQTPQISAPFPTVALGLLASERLVIDGPESEEKKTCECAAQTNRTTTVSTQQQPSEEKTVATAVLHLDVEPRVQVSAGVSYSMAYNAPTFTITKHNEETATVTESVRGNGRTAPIVLLHLRMWPQWFLSAGGSLSKSDATGALDHDAFFGMSRAVPRIPALGMLSLGATYYRRAVLTPGVTVGSPYQTSATPSPLITKDGLAVTIGVTAKIR